MRFAIYARESSDDTSKAPPIEKQIEAGRQWGIDNGHGEPIEVYTDDGYSGGDWNRPGWLKALSDAKRHAYQILWVWNQDRIARDTEQFLYFYRHMTKASCRIFEDSPREFIDMSNLGNRVKHQSLAQAAEIFRLVTSEKVKNAYQRSKGKVKWGRPRKELDMDMINTMRANGSGWRTIGNQLGVSHNTIRRAFHNRVIMEQSKE